MEAGGDDAFADIQDTIRKCDKFNGSQRYPIKIIEGTFKDIEVNITYYLNPLYKKINVEEVIKNALGVYDPEAGEDAYADGLFSLSNRTFGQNEYMTTIAASIQNVPGVLWVKINSNSNIISCNSDQILRLPNSHLTLTEGGG
jgi:hypothetical protein